MSTFSGQPVTIDRPAAEIASRFDDLSVMQSSLDNLSDEDRAKVGEVKFEKDNIYIQTNQVGQIQFSITERSAKRITMTAVGSPVPLTLSVLLKALSDTTTELTTVIDVEIPAMLKPMIGGAMKKAADQFGMLMSNLANS